MPRSVDDEVARRTPVRNCAVVDFRGAGVVGSSGNCAVVDFYGPGSAGGTTEPGTARPRLMGMRRRAAPALAATFSALLVVGFGASDAAAAPTCSCASGSVRERVDQADVVLVGSATARRPADPGPDDPPQESEYDVRVDRAVKGTVPGRVIVRSVGGSGMCGFDMSVDTPYLLHLTGSGASYETGLCSGNVRATDADVARAAREVRPQDRGVVVPAATPSPDPRSPAATSPRAATRTVVVLGAASAVLVLIGTVALSWGRRHRRGARGLR